MNHRDNRKFFNNRDVILLGVLLFSAVLLIVGYDVYQNRTGDGQTIILDVPPVVINKLDVEVFDRLGGMQFNN